VNALSLKSTLATDVVTCGTKELLGEVLRIMERDRIMLANDVRHRVAVDEEARVAPRVAQCSEPAGGTASQAGT